MNDEHAHGDHAEHEAASPDANAVVEQVRELLFGDQRRATDAALKALDDRLAALTATVEARFADLDRRFGELKIEQDSARGTHTDSLGAALVELGERIRSLAAAAPAPKPENGQERQHEHQHGE